MLKLVSGEFMKALPGETMSQFTPFAELRSSANTRTIVGYDFHAMFGDLAHRGEADVAIVPTEDGFSPLGGSRRFFEQDLGVSYDKVIRPLADWNRFENPRVTLVAIQSNNPLGKLRGIILAPGSNTENYKVFGSHSGRHGPPSRNYYYNVSYEAIAYACLNWKATRLSIAHLCGSSDFHEDMATCHAEALGHFCDEHPAAAPESFVFCCCCIDVRQLNGIRRLNAEGGVTHHRKIRVETEVRPTATLLHLDWS